MPEIAEKTAKMQRQHFDFIAQVIRDMPAFAPALRTAKRSAALAFADALATTNPAFNRAKFLTACGEESELQRGYDDSADSGQDRDSYTVD